MVIMKGVKMGVSTVTISIEEFENLILNKKKVEKIDKIMDNNVKNNIKPANVAMITATILGDIKQAKEIGREADRKNYVVLLEIEKTLEAKEL